jgi:hypothetical protein
MPKSKKPKHKQITLTLYNSSEIRVDHAIQELVSLMSIPGLRTLNSCRDDHGTGYVQFRGKLAKHFMHSLLRQWLNAKKNNKPQDAISFANPPNPKYTNSFQIRWNPSDYNLVVRYARIALRETLS